MASGYTDEAGELMTFDEALAVTGLEPKTLRYRLRRDRVPMWTNPADERRRLMRAEDVKRLATPRPVPAKP